MLPNVKAIPMPAAIFACDHAIPVLARHGIVPTAVFSMDGSGFVWSDIYEGVPLIADATASPVLTYSWKGGVHFFASENVEMMKATKPYWPEHEAVVDNCRTVGATMATIAMDNFRPKRMHYFGFDYCWTNPGRQHASNLTYHNMETEHVVTMKGWQGADVRTYRGFWLDAMLLKYRIAEYQAKTGNQVIWYGESIVPAEFKVEKEGDVEKESKAVYESTIVALSGRWRGAARANAILPNRKPLKPLFDAIGNPHDIVLVGAGPTLDITVKNLLDLITVEKEEPCLAK